MAKKPKDINKKAEFSDMWIIIIIISLIFVSSIIMISLYTKDKISLSPDCSDEKLLKIAGLDSDTDSDSIYDVCDNCPDVINKNQLDTDNDGVGNECDKYPNVNHVIKGIDADADSIPDGEDPSPYTFNTIRE